MDVEAFIQELQADPAYAGQIVHVRKVESRPACFAAPHEPLTANQAAAMSALGIDALYSHQAAALDAWRAGRDALVGTGTASGKSLCYHLAIAEMLADDPDARALLLFPTKALCQDQLRSLSRFLPAAGLADTLCGVYDADTPGDLRRRLRDRASVLLTNPDMLHASLMPAHGRWAPFLANLRLIVLDELHVYSGMFGSNMANVLTRMGRLCGHYGSRPAHIACSASIANPLELATRLTGRDFELIDGDGSPRGRRFYVFWNPPRVRGGAWRSRRSANVEAHELMARLIQRGCATIAFSKARMTAEMIHRYVRDALAATAPHLASKVTPYRGGYLPAERREIERRLFAGELLGVSTTPALELGIDVGALDAAIVVGYPGTRASFYQQSGRAGRRDRDALVFLVGLDTAINQYLMSHPEYLFERQVEQAVIDPRNPLVLLGHLRCAAHELPLADADATALFGPDSELVLDVLESNHKVHHIADRWYHAASETPQHETPLRYAYGQNVVIHDADSGAVLGEIDKLDAQPLLHPQAIYMHQGRTYRVLSLDLERNLAVVRAEEVDYYTQPLGGTDVHHVDLCLREKPFGTGLARWGEVTAHFSTPMFEKIRFYELDAISRHGLDLPTLAMDTAAVWLIPPESLMRCLTAAGLDPSAGLRGLGYATRMVLPLLITADVRDFSHSVGCANQPWHSLFIYERYTHGLGYTLRAFERLGELMPAVLEHLLACDCRDGCPCCVGKPLRTVNEWNVERGEGNVPSKAATLMILQGLLGDGSRLREPETAVVADTPAARRERLVATLRRRLQRQRDPLLMHGVQAVVTRQAPPAEPAGPLGQPDAAARADRKASFARQLRRRVAQKVQKADGSVEGGVFQTDSQHALRRRLKDRLDAGELSPLAPINKAPEDLRRPGSSLPPVAFSSHPSELKSTGPLPIDHPPPQEASPGIAGGFLPEARADAAPTPASPPLAAGLEHHVHENAPSQKHPPAQPGASPEARADEEAPPGAMLPLAEACPDPQARQDDRCHPQAQLGGGDAPAAPGAGDPAAPGHVAQPPSAVLGAAPITGGDSLAARARALRRRRTNPNHTQGS